MRVVILLSSFAVLLCSCTVTDQGFGFGSLTEEQKRGQEIRKEINRYVMSPCFSEVAEKKSLRSRRLSIRRVPGNNCERHGLQSYASA